jgi:soluble lytic murein transglycosylase-like protein
LAAIEARQGIILGKAAAQGWRQRSGKAGFSPHPCPLNAAFRNRASGALVIAVASHRFSEVIAMKLLFSLACLAALAALQFPQPALAQRAEYDALVATHAQANGVPEVLVHRVIVRESRYQPRLVGRGGTIGLMQIKLATARSMGYTGDAAGLRDPNTNLTYAVKYLAGAYRAAHGDHSRAVSYYASGYYAAEKRQRRSRGGHLEPLLLTASPGEASPGPANAYARQTTKR